MVSWTQKEDTCQQSRPPSPSRPAGLQAPLCIVPWAVGLPPPYPPCPRGGREGERPGPPCKCPLAAGGLRCSRVGLSCRILQESSQSLAGSPLAGGAVLWAALESRALCSEPQPPPRPCVPRGTHTTLPLAPQTQTQPSDAGIMGPWSSGGVGGVYVSWGPGYPLGWVGGGGQAARQGPPREGSADLGGGGPPGSMTRGPGPPSSAAPPGAVPGWPSASGRRRKPGRPAGRPSISRPAAGRENGKTQASSCVCFS